MFFFYLGFFTNIYNLQTALEEGRYLFNTSLPIPPASQTLKH